jgi:peptide/nickel transport system ATP-binding protein
MTEAHVRVENLTKVFQTRAGSLHAVRDVSFSIARGETLGVVGESGSGKSTMARLVLRLQEPTSGHIYIRDQDIAQLEGKALREARRQTQMVFQDPFGSLLPHFTAAGNVSEPLRLHSIGTRASRGIRARELLELVGIDPKRSADLYPRQFSGGQQQRIAIARALALEPDFLVCDEPTSSLDVSIQSQILNLFQDLQEKMGLTCMFISHNLAVIERVASRVAVMCRGRIVETAPVAQLFGQPRHPYTKTLLAAVLPISAAVDPESIELPELEPWDPRSLDDAGAELEEVGPGHFLLTGGQDGRRDLDRTTGSAPTAVVESTRSGRT